MKYLVLLFAAVISSTPLTINFQMVLKDSLGKPTPLSGARITFQLAGETGISFWSETKTFNTPNGVITTRLGDVVAIDPVSFYAQDMIKVTVIKESSGDTILSEAFNAIPFAFKANYADSSRNATLFQGKAPSDFLPSTFETNIRQSISDSIAAHPARDPSTQISDSVSSARSYAVLRASDTAGSVRTYAVTQDNNLKNSLRGEIRDSIAAHPSIDPTMKISDSSSGVRAFAVAQDSALKTSMRGEVSDSISAHHPGSIIRDSLNARLDQDVKTTSTVSFSKVHTDTINASGESVLFVPNNGWDVNDDSISLNLGNGNSYLRKRWGAFENMTIYSDNGIDIYSVSNDMTFRTSPGKGIRCKSPLVVNDTMESNTAWISKIMDNSTHDTLRIYLKNVAQPYMIIKQ